MHLRSSLDSGHSLESMSLFLDGQVVLSRLMTGHERVDMRDNDAQRVAVVFFDLIDRRTVKDDSVADDSRDPGPVHGRVTWRIIPRLDE
jgi:hypothetical protein